MKLVIISHTEHYKQPDGTIVGWGPTISEINHLAQDFEEIFHIAFLHPDTPPPSSLPYNYPNIKFIPLPPVGGKGIGAKLKVIGNIPKILNTVQKTLRLVDVFQLRTPTGIGVFLIPYLTLFCNKKGWYKYAGNWNQDNPPIGYALQRWMLKNQNRKVTINGNWPKQPKQSLTFENPCLTEEDRIEGQKTLKLKNTDSGLHYCFVGGLNKNKGVNLIFDAMEHIDSSKFEKLHIIGEGVLLDELLLKKKDFAIPVEIYGAMPRESVFEIYKKCHFIILPSESEGFPKVIGEAMNFGCVPIVSNVSCIGQYIIDNKNGFLIEPISREGVETALLKSIEISGFNAMIEKNYNIAERFTFNYFRNRLKKEILNQ